MIIEIKYRDNQNWITVLGSLINWTNYSKKYKPERVQPAFVAPEIIVDTWNGATHDVQHTTWDSFYFQINIKESELYEIVRMKSCKDIVITEFNETATGLIVNKTYTLDLSKSDLIQIDEPERIGATTSFKVGITFRTNRTIINKAIAISNTYPIVAGSTTFYTDFIPIKYFKQIENITYEWYDGVQKVLRGILKSGYEALIYLKTSDYNSFMNSAKYYNSIIIDTHTVYEIEIESTEIGEGLFKIIVRGITGVSNNNAYKYPAHDYYLTITNSLTTSTYYTDYPIELISDSPILSTFDNGIGINTSARNITKTVKRIKFFMDEEHAFEVKKYFELGGTVSLNGETVLESREVIPTRLAYDMYEVNIDCLIDTDDI